MKRCPSCNRTYTDPSLNFCLEDGTPLVNDVPTPADLNATVRYPAARDTAEPPPTEIYRPESPLVSKAPPSVPPPQWSPAPAVAPAKKSNALWWILGGLAAVAVIGVGVVVMIIALASMSDTTGNNNSNANGQVANRNTDSNTNSNDTTNGNTNTGDVRGPFTDDFSKHKWGVAESKYGRIWYADDEYHMSSKEKTFVAMYAPSDDYKTENATVKVTARSVDGSVPSAGFGLLVHCAQSKAKQLEDYGLVIYPAPEPEYEVIMHKAGNQTSLVARTPSSAIRSGTTPNQLEIRIKGTELSFYVNGQYLTKITDEQNYKTGRAGLYTSDTTEVAFDDLEIER
jgi:hypothetical protein